MTRWLWVVLVSVMGLSFGEAKKLNKEKPWRYIYQHIGKAGGSTVAERIRIYGLEDLFNFCHPGACLNEEYAEYYSGELVNIRDPVDRFMSAFDWRKTVLCDVNVEDNETRRANGHIPDWSKRCKGSGNEESEVINVKYGGQVNSLAEALCARGTEEEQAQAAEDFMLVHHSRTGIIKHLGTKPLFDQLRKPGANFTFYVTVLEEGFDFLKLSDGAILELVKDYNGEQAVIEAKERAAKYKTFKESKLLLHSAELYGHKSKPFSAAGACCVARHYREDYELLKPLAKVTEFQLWRRMCVCGVVDDIRLKVFLDVPSIHSLSWFASGCRGRNIK